MRLCPQQLRGGVGSGDGDGWWTYRSFVVVVQARVNALEAKGQQARSKRKKQQPKAVGCGPTATGPLPQDGGNSGPPAGHLNMCGSFQEELRTEH